MERATALKQVAKLLGKSMGYRVDPNAPTREQRTEASAALKTMVDSRNALREARDARKAAILGADKEYQDLLKAAREAQDSVQRLHSLSNHYKFTVGNSNGLFFHIKAQGDSWEEIIDRLKRLRRKT